MTMNKWVDLASFERFSSGSPFETDPKKKQLRNSLLFHCPGELLEIFSGGALHPTYRAVETFTPAYHPIIDSLRVIDLKPRQYF